MKLRLASCPFPFRGSFEHASAVRERAENVIVIAEGANGQYGLGEGCPRSYVTGETVATRDGRDRALAAGRHRGDCRSWRRSRHGWSATAPTSTPIRAPLPPSKSRCSICSRGRPARPIEQLLGIDAQDIDLRTSAVYSSGKIRKIPPPGRPVQSERDAHRQAQGQRRCRARPLARAPPLPVRPAAARRQQPVGFRRCRHRRPEGTARLRLGGGRTDPVARLARGSRPSARRPG